jgi:UDP-N-acetyl-D-galactosamine dehydrogenase
MIHKDINVKKSEILILGFTFKENCPDVRNTKVIDIVMELKSYGSNITIFDPWAKSEIVKHEYDIDTIGSSELLLKKGYDAIVLAVGHDEFMKIDLQELKKANSVVYDVKAFLPKSQVDNRL